MRHYGLCLNFPVTAAEHRCVQSSHKKILFVDAAIDALHLVLQMLGSWGGGGGGGGLEISVLLLISLLPVAPI